MFTPVGEGVAFERFTVQCMNLMKMIVKNDAYKPAKNIEGGLGGVGLGGVVWGGERREEREMRRDEKRA